MDSCKYPNYFNPWKNILNEWKLRCSSNHRTPLDVCVNFAMNSRAQKVLIGVQSLSECTQVLESWKNAKNVRYLSAMPCEDLRLIDPRQWSAR
jgi:ribosome-associated toxin RatA of RatAB toxin-antitoxin module